MKKSIFRVMTAVLALLMAFGVAGCRENPDQSYYLSEDVIISGTATGGDKTAKDDDNTASGGNGSGTTSGSTSGSTSGTTSATKDEKGRTIVKVAINNSRVADTAPLFDALAKALPNIKIQIDYYSAKDNIASQEYIAAKSSTGQLPDVVFDDIANLPMYVGQGLVYPLTDFVKKDADYKYVPSSIMENYTYGGEVYALPHQAYFTCLTLNTDILDALNVDIPALDWSFNDMVEFAKKVSNDKYSFCERLNYLDYYGAGTFSKNSSLCGYNMATRKYEMTNSFAKSMQKFQELRKTPNVEAWSLRLTNQYDKRFGSLDTNAATKLGRTVVVDFEKGTYSQGEFLDLVNNFNWVYHPYPQEIKGRMPVHIDHAWMVSSTKVPNEAFKVLSFMTYSKAGNLARLNAYIDNAKGKSKYKLNLDYYTPITQHPDVVAAAKKLFAGDDTQMYMYNNIGNCFRGDLDKIVPSWGQHWSDSINPTACKVQDGTKDPDSTCKDLQNKATQSLATYWADFDKKLAKVQAEWKAKH